MIQRFAFMILVTHTGGLDFDHGASSLTGSELTAGRQLHFKLNLLIFRGGGAVPFRKSERQYLYYFVCSFALHHQTKHYLTSCDEC